MSTQQKGNITTRHSQINKYLLTVFSVSYYEAWDHDLAQEELTGQIKKVHE